MKVFNSFMVSILLLIGGCITKEHWKGDYDYRKSLYLDFINREYANEPAIPKGSTWEQYWSDVFFYLKRDSSEKESTILIEFIKEQRELKGLPPIQDDSHIGQGLEP